MVALGGTKKPVLYTSDGEPVGDGNPLPVKLSDGTNTAIIDSDGQLHVVLDGKVDTNNGTTINLDPDESWEGSATDISPYAGILVNVNSDQPSSTLGLEAHFSKDGITWWVGEAYTVDANKQKIFTPAPQSHYFKVKYTNGGTIQTSFDLNVMLKKTPFKWSSHNILEPITDNDDAELVKNVNTGQDQDGIFRNIRATEVGNLMTSNFLIEVGRGNIPGYSFERKFGSIDAIASGTPADVWKYGATSGAETYTWSADGVADIDTISSSSSSDTLDIIVQGLDINGDYVSQTATLNGQNKVTLGTSLWRVNRLYNDNGTPLVGNVYVYVDGTISSGVPTVVTTVRGYIAIGDEQTLQGLYTVPNGKSAYMLGNESSLTKGLGATVVNGLFTGLTREFGKVFRVQDQFTLTSAGTSNRVFTTAVPLVFPGKTDFKPYVDTSASVGASWAFTLLLIDD